MDKFDNYFANWGEPHPEDYDRWNNWNNAYAYQQECEYQDYAEEMARDEFEELVKQELLHLHAEENAGYRAESWDEYARQPEVVACWLCEAADVRTCKELIDYNYYGTQAAQLWEEVWFPLKAPF